MEKERQLSIQKNPYWVSEIAELYFKYQLNYSTYSYVDIQQFSPDQPFAKRSELRKILEWSMK